MPTQSLATHGHLLAIPAQRPGPARLAASPRYDRLVDAAADDVACAVSATHREPLAFVERDQRDDALGEHHGAGARHRKPGPPCSLLARHLSPTAALWRAR